MNTFIREGQTWPTLINSPAFVASSYANVILGVAWDPANSSPTLTRTDDAVGMVAAAGIDAGSVTNDFDAAPIFSEITEFTDSLGNVFMRIPKFYVKKTVAANLCTIQVSKTRYPGYYLPACFYNFTTGAELNCYYHGKYKASLDGAALASKVNTYPLVSENIVEFRGYAQANNAAGLLGYQQLDVHAQDVLATLFTVELATLNSQSIMPGFTAGQYSSARTATVAETAVNRIIVANANAALFAVGQTISVGTAAGSISVFYGRTITAIDVYDASNKAITFDGATVDIAIGNVVWNSGWKAGFSAGIAASSGSIVANDGKYPCSYRGIESPWGDVWQLVDGVNVNANQAWVAEDAADYASNLFTSPYAQLSYVNETANGYPTALGYDASMPFAQFPTAVGGSTSTYYSDYYYQSTGQRIALVGGSWSVGSRAGLWSWYLNNASSYAGVTVGGRLLKKAL